MVNVGVSVTFNDFASLRQRLEAGTEKAKRETAKEYIERVQRRVHTEAHDTGEYEAGWKVDAEGNVYNDVPHGVYVEWGTSKMPARPIARQEAEAIAPTYAERMSRLLD